MVHQLIVRTIRFFKNPFSFAALCMLVAGWMILNRSRLAGGPAMTPDQEFKRVMNEMASVDSRAAHALQELADHNARLGVIAAARSAGQGGDRRPIIAGMAKEYAEGRTPYRSRIATMAFADPGHRDEMTLDSFMMAHASVLETMELAGYGKSTEQYMAYLEQARKNPLLWSLVWDDPLALHIWVETQDIETVRTYHRNRDWMADALAMVDFQAQDKECWTLKTAIARLARYELASKQVVQDAELGALGLSIMLTHGGLVDACWRDHQVPPDETAAVIYMNPDLLGTAEGDATWIADNAAWLAAIRNNHPVVWLSAMNTYLALRLFKDAPTYASAILEKYGYADVAALIYQHFDNPETVEAAVRAINAYGDLAFYVFQRYNDEHYSSNLAQHLVDPEIGIRVVPFIVRFGDDAFTRVDKDPAWVDRYFEPDGSPRMDPLEWIQYIPGGAAVQVARQWAKGYPCELEELGWGVVDVGLAVVTLASLGTATPATTSVSTSSQMAKTAAAANRAAAVAIRGGKVARSISRSSRMAQWSERLGAVGRTGKLGQLARVGRDAMNVAEYAGKTIWAGVRVVNWAGKYASAGFKKTIQSWKNLSPAARTAVYRGILATTLVIRFTETTAPNMDKIAEGVGMLVARATAGTVKLLAMVLTTAIREVLHDMLPQEPIRMSVIWGIAGVLVVLGMGGVCWGVKNRHSVRFAPV